MGAPAGTDSRPTAGYGRVEFMNMVIARQAGRREWISLAVLTIPCLLYAMDLTVLNLAVPQLSEDLQPSSTELLWIVDIYGFMAAGSLVTMGSARRPHRPPPAAACIGAAAFGATSLLSRLAPRARRCSSRRVPCSGWPGPRSRPRPCC